MKKSNNPLVATLAGSIAGGIETTSVWPTEYTKTLLQLQKNQGGQQQYKGMIDCASQQIKKNGPLGLYRGLAPALAFSIPKAGIRFGGFSLFQNQIMNITGQENKTPLISLGAGMMSGALEGALVVTPSETIKTKLIEMNQGTVQGIKSIVREKGVSGLYRGVVPTVIKQSSNQGIRFMTFGTYKQFLTRDQENDSLTSYQALFGGMLSGTVSTLGNNPIDMVKTRMQGVEAGQYFSTSDCIKQVLTKEGPLAFYKGVGARLMRVIPGQGIIFACYENISTHLESVID